MLRFLHYSSGVPSSGKRNSPAFRQVLCTAGLLCSLVATAKANLITNGGFETVTPTLATNGICTTDPSVYPYSSCSAAGWTGNYQIGNGATVGIYGVSFGIPQPDPDGHNALILQSSNSLVFTSATQSFDTPAAGEYTLSFDIAKRTNVNNGPQTVTVSLDGVATTGGVFSSLPGTWTLETLTLDLSAGTHSLMFSGLDPSTGDVSAFIDNVSINAATSTGSATPEPGTFALFGTSLVALGAVARKRSRRSAAN